MAQSNPFGWLIHGLAHVQARKLSRPPSSTVLDAHPTIWAAATPEFAVNPVGYYPSASVD